MCEWIASLWQKRAGREIARIWENVGDSACIGTASLKMTTVGLREWSVLTQTFFCQQTHTVSLSPPCLPLPAKKPIVSLIKPFPSSHHHKPKVHFHPLGTYARLFSGSRCSSSLGHIGLPGRPIAYFTLCPLTKVRLPTGSSMVSKTTTAMKNAEGIGGECLTRLWSASTPADSTCWSDLQTDRLRVLVQWKMFVGQQRWGFLV